MCVKCRCVIPTYLLMVRCCEKIHRRTEFEILARHPENEWCQHHIIHWVHMRIFTWHCIAIVIQHPKSLTQLTLLPKLTSKHLGQLFCWDGVVCGVIMLQMSHLHRHLLSRIRVLIRI